MPEDVAARRRVADAMRLLLQRTVATGAPAADLHAAAASMEEAAARLEPHQLDSRLGGLGEVGPYETHPLSGPSSALAPPLVVEAERGRATVVGTYGHAYEGPPGRLHGGFIAAGFDLALGRAVASLGVRAFTGTLSVRYRSATPLFVPLRYEAEVVGTEGRKFDVRGTLGVGGEVTADAEGIWIADH